MAKRSDCQEHMHVTDKKVLHLKNTFPPQNRAKIAQKIARCARQRRRAMRAQLLACFQFLAFLGLGLLLAFLIVKMPNF